MWRRKWLLIVPVLASVVTSLLVVHFVPVRYESQSTLILVHAQIPADFVPQVASRTPEDMRRFTSQVLSRTRLERVINEYGLYKDDRKRGIMEEIVEGMRNDIQITAADDPQASGSKVLKVSFRSTDPRTAQKVTESLAGFIVSDSQNDQANLTQGTVQFLQVRRWRTRRDSFRPSSRRTDRRRAPSLAPSPSSARSSKIPIVPCSRSSKRPGLWRTFRPGNTANKSGYLTRHGYRSGPSASRERSSRWPACCPGSSSDSSSSACRRENRVRSRLHSRP